MGRLRAETRVEHERLETKVDIPSRLASREAYAALVSRFYGYYVAFEPTLLAGLPAELGLDPARRRHLPKLKRDLQALDILAEGLPVTDDLPKLPHPAEAIGALYVIEGSTLGGQIISRMLRDSLGICPECGGAFFSGYGEENGAMWRAFCEAVEAWAKEHGDVEKMVMGARKTFGAMEAWLV